MKVPSISPYHIPTLACVECGTTLRPVMEKQNNGKITSLTHYCDKCEYGFRISLEPARGESVRYEASTPVGKKPNSTNAPAHTQKGVATVNA